MKAVAFEGFLSLGGTEIANASRTKAYADELVPMLGLTDCWDCADLAEVLGDDDYTTPIIDRPDWFTDHDRDSWDFCGFYPLEIEGLDDGVRQATVTELSLDGAVVGAPRYGSREIKITGLLIGVSPASVTYGLKWLGKALEGAPCRGAEGCTGDHLCFYSSCPPMCSDSPALDAWPDPDAPSVRHHESQFYLCDGGLISTWQRACSVDYERTMYQVSLTSGPTIVERYNSHCGSMLRVEFTLVAGVPFAFSTAISAVPGLEPIPDPQTVPEVTCTPGTDVVVRTNLATNPVPVGNATAAGDGWLADGSVFTAAVDTDVARLEGGASVRVTRNAITEPDNLAPNADPADDLDGWAWRLGQSSVGPSRTNLVENPWPRLADGWDYNVPAGQPGTIMRTNYARNPAPAGGASGNGVPGLATYGPGVGESGVTMTSEVPLSSAIVATNWALDPAATGPYSATAGWSTEIGTGTVTNTFVTGITTSPVGTNLHTAFRVQPDADLASVTPVQHIYRASPTGWSVPVGGSLTGSAYVRSLDRDVRVRLVVYNATTGATGTIGPWVDLAGQGDGTGWARLTLTDSVEGATSTGFQVRVQAQQRSGGPQILAGDRFDVTGVLVQPGTDSSPYFDGSTGSVEEIADRRYLHAWTGAPNASPSTRVLTIPPGALSPEGTGFARRVITAAKISGSTGWQARTPAYAGDIADGVAGDTVSVSMWMRYVGPTAQRVRLRVEFFDTATVNTSDSTFVSLTSGQWVQVAHTATATGAYTQLRWWIYQTGSAGPDSDQNPHAGSLFDLANVLIERSATIEPWFSGDTTDTDEVAYSWTGEPGASESIAQAYDSELFTVPMDIEPDELGPLGQTGIARHTQGVADTKAWNVTYTGTQVVADGVTHSQSLYFRSTSQRQVQFGGRTFDVPGYGWVRLTGQFVGDGGPLTLTVSGVGQATGEVIDVARALVEATTSLGTYFDGSTPAGDGYTYAWTGAEDASTSTATLLPVEATTTLETGDGPGDQTTFQRTTIVAPKAGGEDGPAYTMAAGEGLYTATMSVRPSVAVTASLRVSALDDVGTVLTTVSGDPLSLSANTWVQMPAVRIAAPAATTRLQVAVLMPGNEVLPAGETFDAGAVRVIEGVYLTDPVIARATYLGQHDDARNTLDVVAGGVYTASLYAGANVGSTATMVIRFYNSAGTLVQLTRGPQVDLEAVTPIGVAEWHRPYVTATAPTGAVGAVVSIEVRKIASGALVGDAAWLTSMLFEQAQDVLSYFDGSTPDVGQASYEWTGTAHTSTSNALLSVPTDPGPILDPDCPVVPPPPRPPVIDISCVEVPEQWRRYVVDVGADLVPEWSDAVPIIRLQTGGTEVRQVRVRFYPNPLQAPLQALNPCDYCGEFVITYIPADSLMTIDGIRQWVTVTRDPSGEVVTANHLLSSSDGGPVSWPILGCGVAYTLVVDVSPVSVADLEPQICLAARS